MKPQRGLTAALFAVLVLCLNGERTEGTKPKMEPKPALLLARSKQVVVFDSMISLAAYGVTDGKRLHRFQAGGRIQKFDVSADERFLVCCGEGLVALWDLQRGQRLWQRRPRMPDLIDIYDVSFAWDGLSFIVSSRGFAVVYETRGGKEIQKVSLPGVPPVSAALCPDGSKGVLVGDKQWLYTFEVASGRLTRTEVRATGPVRYSADGKYVAYRSDGSDLLRVVKLEALPGWKDKGLYLGQVRPAADGSFLVCGRWGGAKYYPDTGEVKEIWKPRENRSLMWIHDFDPDLMLGVQTRFTLETTVFDLRTGSVSLTIDNNKPRGLADLMPEWASDSPLLTVTVLLAVVVVLVVVVWLIVRHRAPRA
jgi:hypothetical protein